MTLIGKLATFLQDFSDRNVFMLKGYAGTGKTTIVHALVKVLADCDKSAILLAPTGRAAKVLSNYSGHPSYTIHKKIYIPKISKEGALYLTLVENRHKETLIIVDEASMIQDDSQPNEYALFSSRNILEDLFQYVYQGKNCKLLLIGDTAQLPPVGLDISPALDLEYLRSSFSIDIIDCELTEVVRQAETSGILANATTLRSNIGKKKIQAPFFSLKDYSDIERINGQDLEDALNDVYSKYERNNTVIITRSNKRANIYNQEIRHRIFFLEHEITAGDQLMVVKNNYFWLPKDSKAGFIANGDIIELLRINKIEEMYGFRFADVIFRMVDYQVETEIEGKIMLNTLMAESPALPFKESKKLFDAVMEDYLEIEHKYKRILKTRNNPYLNALQVKFSYALTCHKTQGGQWDTVFVDQGYITDKMINIEFLRWLYTAITRASKKLFLVNFSELFFKD
ncbi:ATP-dependent RecD-like DNA helicase [candidate division KSB1 bacterium]